MEAQVVNRQWLPSFQVEGFTGTNQAPDARVYNGFKVGLQLPLWPGTISHMYQAAKLQAEAQLHRQAAVEQELLAGKKQDENYLAALTATLEGMERDALPLAEEMQATLRAEYELGISDFFQFLFALEESRTIYIEYVNALRAHNNAVIHFNKTY
jgi:cobalt-zinc-cadmium resistance protein CzcA